MKLLVDANVLLDVALEREGFFEDSDAVVGWCQDHPGTGLIAWHTISNLYYLLRKAQDNASARGFIETVLEIFEVSSTGTIAARHALSLKVNDFEDALQIAAALHAGADLIVTRDQVDYAVSPLPVKSPSEFLASVSN
jgi:predicted nucleic acid-binding protein